LNAVDRVAELYEGRDFTPAWREPARIDALLGLIDDAWADGLDPEDYHRADIGRRRLEARSFSPAERASFELTLTDALISLVHHQRFGKTDPADRHEGREPPDSDAGSDTLALVREAIEAPSLRRFLEERISRGPYYRRLRAALARYRRIASEGDWPAIPDGPSLEAGMNDRRLPALALRLRLAGDLEEPKASTHPVEMDATLVEAVRRFQTRHGLTPDGIVGPATLLALNAPVEARIQQLRLALERLRWLSGGLDDMFIAVNIAGFRIYFVADRRILWESRVVVGKAQQQTPVFRGVVDYIVFNPSWSVPYSIATREMLPEIKTQPDWFERNGYEVRDERGARVDPATVDWSAVTRRTFDYSLVQPPGPANALGQVKFVFPNRHSVYLHDTPAKQLFSTAARAFSHGCIRVENPLELAGILLGPDGWDRRRIDAAVANGNTSTVFLSRPVPILLLYSTATVDPDGTVHFYPDIYRRDAAVARALDGPFRIP
ncbi:MAG TPA: L,D-transpeptidase family protein, partial [Woeseiaceae bacterium]|nr:L,D-transpeptidase family protein [Woeseiaceae bacterium]